MSNKGETDRIDIQADYGARIVHSSANYFTVIRAYCEILGRISVPGSKHAIKLQLISDAAAAWLASDRRLLAFSANYQLQRVPVRINALIADEEMHLRRLLGDEIDFDLTLAINLPLIQADPDSLSCLFSDLAVNARRALHGVPLPEFRIETAYRNNEIVICVTDNGCGMDEAMQKRIMSGESVASATPGRTGLGMGFVRKTVSQIGGRWEIQSSPWLGTTFTFCFPQACD
jgi:signal transduction histidine kinase